MAIDFSRLQGKDLGAVKRPPTPPGGAYNGRITKYEFAESRFDNRETNAKDGVLKLHVKPEEYLEGELPEGVTLADKVFSTEYSIVDAHGATLKGLYYVKTFAETLGISTAGRDIMAVAPEMIGCPVTFDLTERPDKNNPEVIYNDVRKLRARAS